MQKFKLATLNVLLYTRSGAKCTYDTLAFSWRHTMCFINNSNLMNHTTTHTKQSVQVISQTKVGRGDKPRLTPWETTCRVSVGPWGVLVERWVRECAAQGCLFGLSGLDQAVLRPHFCDPPFMIPPGPTLKILWLIHDNNWSMLRIYW